MAIKEFRKTWSDCQLDYVREYIVTSESDIEHLPECCIGSTCVVSETNNRYVCGKGKQWKLQEEAIEEGNDEGGGGGVSLEPILINYGADPMTASIPFEEACVLSATELAARLCVHNNNPDFCYNVTAVMKNNTRTWGSHIIVRFEYMEAQSSGAVIVNRSYVLWNEWDEFRFLNEEQP